MARHEQKVPEQQPYKPTRKATLPPINERARKICKKCGRMAKHRSFKCKYQPASANKALIMDVNRPGKTLKHVTLKKSKANFTASQNQDDGSDEETRYQGSFGTKATKDDQIYAHFTHSTSAMDFSNVITNAGCNCFSYDTDTYGYLWYKIS